jgi:amino acid adenylation domain-containing protein
MFVLQNLDIPVIEIPRLKLTPLEYDIGISKFDLTFICEETSEKLLFTVEYRTQLFKEETIQRFINFFKKIVSDVTRNPGIRISGIELISQEERDKILYGFNNTGTDYPADKTISQLFENQVERTPHHIALVGQSAGRKAQSEKEKCCAITYRELNKKSTQLARLLIEKGVKSDTIVGVMVERSPEMIIGILGILKAFGAYLPIDPDYPEERIRYMLRDSASEILVTTQDCSKEIKFDKEIIYISDAINRVPTPHHLSFHSSTLPSLSSLTSTLTCQVSPANAVYIMYTSGTTGKAKGVMVEHRNVVRLVINTNYVKLSKETRILQTGAPVFDATTFEIWGALLHGGQLVLLSNDTILDAHQLGKALTQYKITTLWLTSPLFNQLMLQNNNIFPGLKYLLVGGDVLSPQNINMVRDKNKSLAVINGYGPTENTTFSTTYLVEKDFQHNIPIGRPISNSTAYILDKNDHLQPVGVSGELVVGGDGISKGYLNSPELTAEKFGRAVISSTLKTN